MSIEAMTIGFGVDDCGRATIHMRVEGDGVISRVIMNPVGARAYGNMLLQAAQEVEKINKAAFVEKSAQSADPT